MGWLRKNFKKAKKKLKKFFKSDVGKVIGTVALAVAGFYMFGPAAVGGIGQATAATTAATATATGATNVISSAAAGATTQSQLAAAAAGVGQSGIPIVPAATTASEVSTAVQGVSGASGVATIDTITKGTGDALTRGSGVAEVGNIAGTTQEFGNNELASNIIDTANVNASNGNHIISNNLTDATTDVLDFYQGPNNQGAKNLFKQQTALGEEYTKRGLFNLAEQPISDAAQTKLLFKPPSTRTAGSLLDKPSFETNLINDKSLASMKFDSAAYRPEFSSPTGPEQGYYLGKNLGLSDDNLLQASKTKIGEAFTSDYATGTAQGVSTGILTNVIMGQGEESGGGGQLVSYDKSIGNARNYVADISQQYQNKTGQVLPFNMFTNTTMPLYGPSSPQNIIRNPYIT